MSLKYLYTQTDGTIAVVIAVPKEQLGPPMRDYSDEEFEAWILKRSIPVDATNVNKMPEDWTPPEDRYFRNAWKQDEGEQNFAKHIAIDMVKAREIQKNKIRKARTPLLEALDVDYQRADERADNKAKVEIANRKQLLRDATDDEHFATARTPEELKKVWPL